MSCFKKLLECVGPRRRTQEPRPQPAFPTGLEELYTPLCERTADIILIHDITDDLRQTWTTNNIVWPKDLLPKELIHLRVFAFGYDGRVTNMSEIVSAERVRRHAESLLVAVTSRLERDAAEIPGVGNRPIIFCAHGLGGIICEQALVTAEAKSHSLWALARGIMLFGVPHFRAGTAEWAALVARSIGLSTKRAQRQDWSPFQQDFTDLANMQSKFCDIVDPRETAGRIKICCFYEEIQVHGNLMISPEWAILPKFRIVPIARDHFGMTKLDSRDAKTFRCIVGTLYNWLSN
ncbi:hypothetical protein F5Y10DRAFT_166899 [Nemania abortiva]|nr:hypothetical protein F5Y10DRAFT_166899 [Nemania abortiva]